MDLSLADTNNWSTSPQPRKSTTQIPPSPKLLHSPTIGNTRSSFKASYSANSPTSVHLNGNTSINKIRKRKKMADTEKEEAINLVSLCEISYLSCVKLQFITRNE